MLLCGVFIGRRICALPPLTNAQGIERMGTTLSDESLKSIRDLSGRPMTALTVSVDHDGDPDPENTLSPIG